MKKLLFIFCFIFCVTSFGINAYAGTDESILSSIDSILDTVQKEKTDAASELSSLLKLSLFKGNDQEDDAVKMFENSSYDLDSAYKAYTISTLLITDYKKHGSFSSIMTDSYQWIVPFINSVGTAGYVTIAERDGKLTMLGKSIGDNLKNEFISEEMIRNALTESDIIKKPLTSITFLQSFAYNTNFVLLSDGETEYVIPFALRPEWSPVKNGVLYTADELIDLYWNKYDEEETIKHPERNGGVALRKNTDNINKESEEICNTSEETPETTSPVIPVWGSDAVSQSIDNVLSQVREEKESVKPILTSILKIPEQDENDPNNSGVLDMFKTSGYDFESAYKAYRLPHLFIAEYKNKGGFLSMMEDSYQWKVPFKNTEGISGYATIGEKKGELAYLGKAVTKTADNEFISEESIRKAISDSELIKSPLESITYLQSFMYNTIFVVLFDGKTEFVIPLAIRPEWSPVENGKLYTAEDLIAIYYDTYDEDALLEHGDEDGGVPLRKYSNSSSSSQSGNINDLHTDNPPANSVSDSQLPADDDASYAHPDDVAFPVIPTIAIGGGAVLVLGLIVLLKKRH